MRFPEFSGEWERCKVKDFTKVVAGATPSTSNKEYWGGDIRWMNSGELNLKRVCEVQGRITQLGYEKTSTKIIPPQSVLIGLAGQGKTRGTAAINYVELCTNQSIASILPSDKYYPEFLYQNIESRYKELRDISSGDGGRGGLNLQMIYNLNIPYCSISEQRKIGDFLCLLDQRIETQRKIIEKYESLIRGLITYVNKGEGWKCKATALRDVLTEVHEKNVENYEVCSVSVSHGVINQIDYLGRSFAAKEVLHYNVVNYGNIVYTKSPTGEFPYGIVKRSNLDRPVAVSPLYGVYRPVNDYVGIYLHLYFKSPVNTKNYLHRLIQKGAKNTINITNQHFLDNKILIPENGWLEIIVNAASIIEKMIQIECNALLCLESQKNYLLSKMFI